MKIYNIDYDIYEYGKYYVVYDPKYNLKDGINDGWIIAKYEVGDWTAMDEDKSEWEIHPTHFTEYYGLEYYELDESND